MERGEWRVVGRGAGFPSASWPRSALRLRFSADSLLKSAIIALLVLATALVCQWRSLKVPAAEIWPPVALTAALLGLAFVYRARGEDAFVRCLTALAQIVAFVSCYIVLMYAVTTFAWPLVDLQLAACDAWCGVNVADIRRWTEERPAIALPLRFAYDTLLYQTAAVVAILGLRGDRRRLESFVLAFMLAALVTLLLYVVTPASGPFVTYGFSPSADQARFLEHFESLRDGSRSVVGYRGAEGLITYPSFHVAWALLLAWAFRGRWRLFAAFALLNAMVIASTVTTGWHYFTDVLAGAAVAFVAAMATTLINRNAK